MNRTYTLLFILFFLILYLFFSTVKPSLLTDTHPILVKIDRGSSTKQIAKIVKEKKILHSPTFFLFLSKVTGKSRSFNHGTYILERGHYWKTIRTLELGLTYKIKVTIPEGWSSYQVAERLKKKGIIDDLESFILYVKAAGYEGYLFPESYFFEPMTQPGTIVQAMVHQFKKNYMEEWVHRANELKMTELQIVTLASIIEREAQMDSERAFISSVYHNRLKKKMLLEADPTIQYALSDGRFWKPRLTYRDLNVKSLYNTYHRMGLPPFPICNPGLKSIQAALYPAETDFLFFVADGKGGHNFFKSYREHIRKQLEDRKER